MASSSTAAAGGLIGTTSLTEEQWLIALVAGVSLLVLWELGKLVYRRMSPVGG